jgi:hypothetical protein
MIRKLILSLCLALSLTVLAPNITSAAYSLENYTPQDRDVNATNGQALKPSEILALYPMSQEDEAAIVHEVPMCSVTIDGVVHEGNEISIFNGQRLHFTLGKTNDLYAFTEAEAMEEFLEREYGPIFDIATGSGTPLTSSDDNEVFENWWYGGKVLRFPYGEQFPQLYLIGWDNCISSARISEDGPVTLWDYDWFGGDSFTMTPGSNHSMLYFEGWNDRASSVS